MVRALKTGGSYVVYKRSLPLPGINKVVAQNIGSYEEGLQFIKEVKLKTKEIYDNDGKATIIYYDILPDTVLRDNIFYNDANYCITGTNKKKAAIRYMDLEEI
jgi:hypothetical protein